MSARQEEKSINSIVKEREKYPVADM